MSGGSRWFLVIALIASACGGTQASSSLLGTAKRIGAEPTLTPHVAPQAGWPFRVDRIALTLDGAPWRGAQPVSVGEHTVITYVDVSMPCDAFGAQSGHMHMRSVRTFAVAPGDAATLEVTLVDHGVLVPVEQRLALVVTPMGAHGERGAGPEARTCARREHPREHAACVVAPMLATARAVGDGEASACLERALADMAAPHAASELRALERRAQACTEWAPLEDVDQVSSDCALSEAGL